MGTEISVAPARTPDEIRLIANDLRHDIIRMLEAAKSGHPGGSLSVADILATLWFSGAMRYDQTDPAWEGRDRVILSKGHAAPALYAVFHQLGWIDDEDIPTLRHIGSRLQGHPDNKTCPGVEVCSGSLGQGLSVSCGIALGFRMDSARDGSAPKRVFCVVGDGELQEGSNWEALMFAAHHRLSNVTAFLDLNDLQIDGHVSEVCSLGDVEAKLRAFGWNVISLDGHDVEALESAIGEAKAYDAAPTMLVCHTIKGKGVPFMENQVDWHGKAPDHEQAVSALAALDAERARLLAATKEAR
ncbi:MAG: transketolase [Atopobiaceae bacterium]|jgi:transketolase|nr:transketolase [Atopobiaceae bacterium]